MGGGGSRVLPDPHHNQVSNQETSVAGRVYSAHPPSLALSSHLERDASNWRYFEKEGGTFINMGLAARDEGKRLPAVVEAFSLRVSQKCAVKISSGSRGMLTT